MQIEFHNLLIKCLQSSDADTATCLVWVRVGYAGNLSKLLWLLGSTWGSQSAVLNRESCQGLESVHLLLSSRNSDLILIGNG